MKKIAPFLTLLSLIICSLFSACDWGVSDKKMIDYYSDDDNYQAVEGVVISKPDDDLTIVDDFTIEVYIITENNSYPHYHYGNDIFKFYSHTYVYDEINVGDTINLISAPMYFYNGQVMPVIALEKDGQVLIPFEEGKAAYIDWIKNN